ncbi:MULTISPECIES: hypothetical protein [Bacillus]|uniref:hypothetical protein n=1 Tax=Bacillus TaxID=1386 RepID=UPI0011A33DDF|nr:MULTISPECIES: hypothetical protein [Bacillus]MBT2166898.1 hypothetical protein [Bacillus subtilis]MDQ1876341.1 hypothetical protein [Bacillus subtilis]UZJ47602.1 hypothetical protein OOZ27_18690 [Bacillus subtilis]
MSLQLDVYKKMLQEVEDQHSQLTDDYESAHKAFKEKEMRLACLDSIIRWKEQLGQDSQAFKAHFKVAELRQEVEKSKREMDKFYQDYQKKAQLNNELISHLIKMIEQEENQKHL